MGYSVQLDYFMQKKTPLLQPKLTDVQLLNKSSGHEVLPPVIKIQENETKLSCHPLWPLSESVKLPFLKAPSSLR